MRGKYEAETKRVIGRTEAKGSRETSSRVLQRHVIKHETKLLNFLFTDFSTRGNELPSSGVTFASVHSEVPRLSLSLL